MQNFQFYRYSLNTTPGYNLWIQSLDTIPGSYSSILFLDTIPGYNPVLNTEIERSSDPQNYFKQSNLTSSNSFRHFLKRKSFDANFGFRWLGSLRKSFGLSRLQKDLNSNGMYWSRTSDELKLVKERSLNCLGGFETFTFERFDEFAQTKEL